MTKEQDSSAKHLMFLNASVWIKWQIRKIDSSSAFYFDLWYPIKYSGACFMFEN